MGAFIFSGGEPWAFALRVSTALGFTLYAEKIYKKPFQTRIGKTVKIENSVLDLIFRMCYNKGNQESLPFIFSECFGTNGCPLRKGCRGRVKAEYKI